MTMCEFTISLEITTLVLLVLVVIVIVAFLIKTYKKHKISSFTISGIEVGMSPSLTLSLDNSDRQIAYRVWVDINTRTIAVPINLEVDNIKAINDSFYNSFLTTRELIKDIPVHKLSKSKELVELLTNYLNNLLRPYLTKWGTLYKEWYENAQKEQNGKLVSFIELQRSFPQYKELTKDLLEINKKVITFSDQLHKIAFGE